MNRSIGNVRFGLKTHGMLCWLSFAKNAMEFRTCCFIEETRNGRELKFDGLVGTEEETSVGGVCVWKFR